MSVQPLRKNDEDTPALSPEEEAAAKAVGGWVQQFARTLKNCRLYDRNNPHVLRFRQQLAAALHQVIREHGAFTLRFGSDDVTFAGVSLYPAKTRDDNLALPFYRDGVRSITFTDNVEPRELDALITALIGVTGQRNEDDDDLVTLLWEAQLRHIDVDYVPSEGEVGEAGEVDGELVPWPTTAAPEPAAQPDDHHARELPEAGGDSRSDDWEVGEPTAEFETAFAELQQNAAAEVSRFAAQFKAERERDLVAATVTMATAFLASEPEGADLTEVGKFLPRLLRAAVEAGRWMEARETVALLRRADPRWSPVAFVQELQQPVSIAAIQQRLAGQGEPEFAQFIVFARDLGESTIDLIGQLLPELSEHWQLQRLCEGVVTMCKDSPERLGPWLADRRPAVVRAGVQILGAIGGAAIVGPLQAMARYADARVRLEVVLALRNVPVAAAKPLLVQFAESGDARLAKAALQKLSETRDVQVAQMLLLQMIQPEFEERAAEEKHAVYSALGLTGGDEVIPELEAELLKGGWFERVNESHRQAVARCIARIGTPMARMVLEHGAQSRRAQVRDVCKEMLQRFGDARA